jgi:hypothetical protein
MTGFWSLRRESIHIGREEGECVLDKQGYDEVEKVLKAQRHEFINHIQVIYAMLQMGRVENAMRYIEDLAKDPDLIAGPLSLYKKEITDYGKKS